MINLVHQSICHFVVAVASMLFRFHAYSCILSVPFKFVDIKRDLNAVLIHASPIPVVRVPSQDVIDAEELGDATNGIADGPEDRLDNVLNQVADGLLHGPDES